MKLLRILAFGLVAILKTVLSSKFSIFPSKIFQLDCVTSKESTGFLRN